MRLVWIILTFITVQLQLLFMFTEIFKSCCSVKLCEYKMLPSLIVINNIDLFAVPPSPISLPLCFDKLR